MGTPRASWLRLRVCMFLNEEKVFFKLLRVA